MNIQTYAVGSRTIRTMAHIILLLYTTINKTIKRWLNCRQTLKNYSHFMQNTSNIRCSKLFRPTNMIVNFTIVFNTSMNILCCKWLLEVWSQWESPNSSPEMLCQAFTAAAFCCLFVGLCALGLVFTNWKAALMGWDQVTDLPKGITKKYKSEIPIFLPSSSLEMFLLYNMQ